MSKLVSLGLVIGACVSTSFGQSVAVPHFYVWGQQPQGSSLPDPSSSAPQMYNMVRVFAFGATCQDDPECNARSAAAQIHADLQTRPGDARPRLVDGKVCILIQAFGMDDVSCDVVGSAAYNAQCRFFREEDRIPGVDDFLSPWPNPRGTDPQSGLPTNSDARAYRHPFLINGGWHGSRFGCHQSAALSRLV